MNLAKLRATAAKATAGPADLRPNLEALRLAMDPELAAAKAEWVERQAASAWGNRAIREGKAEHAYGHKSGSSNCLSCGSFKPEPAAICSQCGDDPVTHNGDAHEFNRAYGYAS